MAMATWIWLTVRSECERGFSARSILRLMYNNHLLQLTSTPSGSSSRGERSDICQWDHCVNATQDVLAFYPSVHSVTSIPHPTQLGKRKIFLHTSTGHVGEHDHVIMTCHFTTFEILKRGDNNKGGGVRKEEKEIPGGFKWTRNPTVLHSDVSFGVTTE
ncbi:hypothetical protein CPB86DRAFT_847194 [Serendipita vermifera]|nr:hypothetical protein CPB86DRAFT_847194 [Serendipita vermifera]